jgi:rubrerythrin
MNQIQMLQDVLNNEIQHQLFYNEQSVLITNPSIRQFLFQLRDDKMRNITLLQNEITKMEQQGKR